MSGTKKSNFQTAIGILKNAESGQVSDAIETLGLEQQVITGFGRYDGGSMPLIGEAYTIRQARKSPGEDRAEIMVTHGAAARGEAPSGSVIVIDVGGDTQFATWGANHTRRCAKNGIAGAYIYGATRDVEALTTEKVPIFACGASPIKSRWNLKTVEHQKPVRIQSVTITPGDILFVDQSGCVVIKQHDLERVANKTDAILQAEARQRSDELSRE